jgi:uncharacterized FlaG/YvyC family protein
MDVSAIAPGTGSPAPAASDAATHASSVPSSAPVESSSPSSESTSGVADHQAALAPIVAKIFGASGGLSTPVPLNVSYRVLDVNLGEIVTVFTDPSTGREVAQFPPSVLIGIAQFFDQQSGATLDKTA